MNDTNEEKGFAKKAQYFLDNYKPIHCTLKTGRWANGYILEMGTDYFLLNEFKQGEVPIFFVELISIEPYVVATQGVIKDEHT